jgi:hypothetical protein
VKHRDSRARGRRRARGRLSASHNRDTIVAESERHSVSHPPCPMFRGEKSLGIVRA